MSWSNSFLLVAAASVDIAAAWAAAAAAAWAAEAVPAITAAEETGRPEVELTSVVLQPLFPFPDMAPVASGVEQKVGPDDVEDEQFAAKRSWKKQKTKIK